MGFTLGIGTFIGFVAVGPMTKIAFNFVEKFKAFRSI